MHDHAAEHGCLRRKDPRTHRSSRYELKMAEKDLQKITDDFNAANPNITVKLENQGGYLDLFDKLMAAAKANQLPNMAQIYSNRLSWYVAKDLVLDLNTYLNDPEVGFTEEDKADFPQMFMDNCIWGDKLYAMPFNKSMMVLYYNEGMLKEAGVERPGFPA